MTLEEALRAKEIPPEIRATLSLTEVPYWSFDDHTKVGHLVIHTNLRKEVQEIFATLSQMKFPIERVVPVVSYGWDDEASMRDNNTSAFNYRFIAGTGRLSNHSFGRAIDINPMLNPYTQKDGKIVPRGASYNPERPGTITKEVAEIFTSRGWEWGGNWERKDWQHFEKPLPLST